VLCGELHLGREAARDAEDETAHLVLAFAGEKPVGTGRLVQRGELLLLEHLSVLPQYRRQGLGRLLVGYFAGEAGVDLLAVAPDTALAFFVAAGFIVEKEDPPVAFLRLKA
jgi:GNAT superfamily N-acetyltransferase